MKNLREAGARNRSGGVQDLRVRDLFLPYITGDWVISGRLVLYPKLHGNNKKRVMVNR